MLSDPLVTCIMPTFNRRKFIPEAITCFLCQTYELRELLILDDGTDPVEDLVPADDRIRYQRLRGRLSIGAKRNLSCSRARGEVIVHFDDDDWSAPARVEDQVNRLIETGAPITGYRSMKFTDGARWWRYKGSPRYALGTSLCYRRDWWLSHPFRDIGVGEDNHFVKAAANVIVSVDAGELMRAMVHPGNTSTRKFEGPYWEEIAA